MSLKHIQLPMILHLELPWPGLLRNFIHMNRTALYTVQCSSRRRGPGKILYVWQGLPPYTIHNLQADGWQSGCKIANIRIQSFNIFLSVKLSAAAVYIYGFAEKTLTDYQEEVNQTKLENHRLPRLLDLVYKLEIRLRRTGTFVLWHCILTWSLGLHCS